MKPKNLYTAIVVLSLVFVASALAQDEPAIEELFLPEEPLMLDEEPLMSPEELQLLGTITLSNSGWSDPTVGTWDSGTKTGTLTQDLTGSIQIVNDGIILDGDGHTIASSVNQSGTGIYLPVRIGVTIKNVNVTGFFHGIRAYASSNIEFVANAMSNNAWAIRFEWCDGCTLTGNTASNNWIGFYVNHSNNITLTGNTASNNSYWGRAFYLNNSDYNILRENVALNNSTHGILLASGSDYNTIMDNISSNNSSRGIYIADSCNNNTVTDNTISSNRWYGINIRGSSNNVITGNAISNNSTGILINSYTSASYDNRVYNNNFIDNSTQASVSGSGNIFNLGEPTGGNYWSNWTEPDDNGDGIVDSPYTFPLGGHDDFPWAEPDGWLLAPPPTPGSVNSFL